MAFHLIPFIAGATVGGLATYLLGDKKVRQDLKRTAGDISEGIGRMRKKDAGTSPAAAKKTVEKKPVARKTAARKAPARKAPAARAATAEAAEKQPG